MEVELQQVGPVSQHVCECMANCWGTISCRSFAEKTIHFSLLTIRRDTIQYYGYKLLPLLSISLKGEAAQLSGAQRQTVQVAALAYKHTHIHTRAVFFAVCRVSVSPFYLPDNR